MSYGLRVQVKLSGDTDMHDRVAKAHSPASMRRFHDNVGVYLATQMHDRLVAQVSGRQLRAPGLRQALLNPATNKPWVGKGGIFEVDASRVEVGSNLPHAAHVHYGGTILPVTGRALAIPLTDKLKRAGKWPREFPRDSLVFVPSESGRAIGLLFEKTATGRRRKKPSFLLVAQVTHQPRPYAYIDNQNVDRITEMWHDHLDAEGR